MSRAILVALGTGTVITSAAAIGLGTAAGALQPREAITVSQYRAQLDRIAATTPQAMAGCETLRGVPREVCLARVEAHATVRTADLEEAYRGTDATARAALRARIDARYAVARARCLAERGYAREQCLIAAHAARGRALLQSNAAYLPRRRITP